MRFEFTCEEVRCEEGRGVRGGAVGRLGAVRCEEGRGGARRREGRSVTSKEEQEGERWESGVCAIGNQWGSVAVLSEDERCGRCGD